MKGQNGDDKLRGADGLLCLPTAGGEDYVTSEKERKTQNIKVNDVKTSRIQRPLYGPSKCPSCGIHG
ncbi:hypothetical protein CEXT_714101 [Caerostris extrusa]|uniref:Uncharacterized protein n=1 Tax=Caerostris extrusa TaxID=172846 RepID=A0AAV4N5A5_CAEEX|nr:hypothetical protein CEXT_714101 [Caerostris extrusa]